LLTTSTLFHKPERRGKLSTLEDMYEVPQPVNSRVLFKPTKREATKYMKKWFELSPVMELSVSSPGGGQGEAVIFNPITMGKGWCPNKKCTQYMTNEEGCWDPMSRSGSRQRSQGSWIHMVCL
jgi:hypothetical protein